MRAPARVGDTAPGIVAAVLDIPISIPAYLATKHRTYTGESKTNAAFTRSDAEAAVRRCCKLVEID